MGWCSLSVVGPLLGGTGGLGLDSVARALVAGVGVASWGDLTAVAPPYVVVPWFTERYAQGGGVQRLVGCAGSLTSTPWVCRVCGVGPTGTHATRRRTR